MGKTVPEVLSTARGRKPRDVLKTDGTVFPNTDRPLENYFIRNICVDFLVKQAQRARAFDVSVKQTRVV